VLILLVPLAFPVLQIWPSAASEQRISIRGAQFFLEDGSPFVFLGGNFASYRFVVQRGEVYTKAEIDDIVSKLASFAGAKMLRVAIYGAAFEPRLGTYDETAFRQLDSVLTAAASNGIRVIVVLRDYAWNPWPRDLQDPYWLFGGGTQARPNKDAILSNLQAKKAYKQFISYVLNRVNTVSGQQYKDDPNIFAWDLLNEPNFTDQDLLSSWVTEIRTYVRSIDTNHFLTIGCPDTYPDWWNPGAWNWRVLRNPLISFVDLHYYAPASLYNPINESNVARIEQRLATALKLGKPVIFGEFGAEATERSGPLLRYLSVPCPAG
jgi:mannan endo-1,4-beta-mannosidase